MTPKEKALHDAIIRRDAQAKRNAKRVETLRAELGAECTHPNPLDYFYEHDDGYGRQTKLKGLLCPLCLSKNPYPTLGSGPSRWIHPEDWWDSP